MPLAAYVSYVQYASIHDTKCRVCSFSGIHIYLQEIDFEEAVILWKLIHDPAEATAEDILRQVFTPGNYTTRTRYYVHKRTTASNINPTLDDEIIQNILVPSEQHDKGQSPYEAIKFALAYRDNLGILNNCVNMKAIPLRNRFFPINRWNSKRRWRT